MTGTWGGIADFNCIDPRFDFLRMIGLIDAPRNGTRNWFAMRQPAGALSRKPPWKPWLGWFSGRRCELSRSLKLVGEIREARPAPGLFHVAHVAKEMQAFSTVVEQCQQLHAT
jgi:hypothetical protein